MPSVQAAFHHPLVVWFVMCQSGRKSFILKYLLNGFHKGDSWTGGSTKCWRQRVLAVLVSQADMTVDSFVCYILYRSQTLKDELHYLSLLSWAVNALKWLTDHSQLWLERRESLPFEHKQNSTPRSWYLLQYMCFILCFRLFRILLFTENPFPLHLHRLMKVTWN